MFTCFSSPWVIYGILHIVSWIYIIFHHPPTTRCTRNSHAASRYVWAVAVANLTLWWCTDRRLRSRGRFGGGGVGAGGGLRWTIKIEWIEFMSGTRINILWFYCPMLSTRPLTLDGVEWYYVQTWYPAAFHRHIVIRRRLSVIYLAHVRQSSFIKVSFPGSAGLYANGRGGG